MRVHFHFIYLCPGWDESFRLTGRPIIFLYKLRLSLLFMECENFGNEGHLL